MNTCPNCQSTLPDWAQQCQFCGAAVRPLASPVRRGPPKKSNYMFGIATWVWVAYYVIASWFVAGGLFTLTMSVIGLVRFNQATADTPLVQPLNFIFYLGMALALAAIAVGAGLLLQNDFVKGVANWYCAAMAMFGIYSFLMYMGYEPSIGRTIMLARSGFDVVCGGLMIYCILETNENSAF